MASQARNYTPLTLKKLFAHSGNQCSFPNCKEILVTPDNALNSNICHIEGANEKGERYNPNMTDKQRADYENLILLCPQHHRETDDVTRYSVTILKNMKQQHEDMITSKLNIDRDKAEDTETLNSFMKFIPFHHLEYYIKHLPNSLDGNFFFYETFEDFKKDKRGLYPFNNQDLNNNFDLFIDNYISLINIILDDTIDTNGQYNNFVPRDYPLNGMQMNKQFLSYDSIDSLTKKIELAKQNFLQNYIHFIDFLRAYYPDVHIKGEGFIG